jgi:cytoskeletal protein CcmA (bactofilin family)
MMGPPGRLASMAAMSFLGSLVRYFDGREREPAPMRFLESGAPTGVLSAGLAFKGEVSGEGDLVIAGNFEGEINVTGTVRVGEEAEVEANISAAMIVIAGVVRGNVSANTHVEMLPTGTLTGTVRSGSLVAAEGASLRGEVWVERPSRSAAPSESGFTPLPSASRA